MTPDQFIAKWSAATLKESSASQTHFNDLCLMLGIESPAEADPDGEWYCFERGAKKSTGGKGWADVWKRDCFGWEYKGKGKDLDAAYAQLQRYAVALENPPLLIVSDLDHFRIHTNWTNTVSVVHDIALEELTDAGLRAKLRYAFTEPERLKPDKTRDALTKEQANLFAKLAQTLRERGFDPKMVAHFINRLVFCMFAEDVDLLPTRLFAKALAHCYSSPAEFQDVCRQLFAAMAMKNSRIGLDKIEWFNGGLFDDDTVLSLTRTDIGVVLAAAQTNWADVDPSIFGTLFERGLDPANRVKLGAHYTDRDKIMLIVEPVVLRPWRADSLLKQRTLTILYNERPTWLINAHQELDEAVAAAYGWPADLSDEEVLKRLFDLNQERARLQALEGEGSPSTETVNPSAPAKSAGPKAGRKAKTTSQAP